MKKTMGKKTHTHRKSNQAKWRRVWKKCGTCAPIWRDIWSTKRLSLATESTLPNSKLWNSICVAHFHPKENEEEEKKQNQTKFSAAKMPKFLFNCSPQMRLNRRNSWCNCANQHAWHGARASGSSVHRLSYSSFTSHCARYFCCKF